MNATFVRRHARFGKARMRRAPAFPKAVWFGAPTSEQFLRCYEKPKVGFRTEIQFNRGAIKKYGLDNLNEWTKLPEIARRHIQFVRMDWPRLGKHLERNLRTAETIFRRARALENNLDELMRFLRQVSVSNPSRFLISMPVNGRISLALERLRRQWERDGQNQKPQP
jgi:hypothetical protein